tara:strand:+ start:231 stop:392 length:162 start_codon:yes stop_codon:yes gene_type:complete
MIFAPIGFVPALNLARTRIQFGVSLTDIYSALLALGMSEQGAHFIVCAVKKEI